jgi:hypothetical protein
LGGDPSDSEAQDECVDAEPACPDIVYFGSTSGSTNDGSASCGSSGSSPDVWYVYRPATNGTLTVSLCGSAFDTVLSVHTDCPGDADNEVACNDDYCDQQSQVTLEVSAGTLYRIRIAGHSGASGLFMMALTGPEGHAYNDCNGNGVPDDCDIADGTSRDFNGNAIPDECECLGDIVEDDEINLSDLAQLVGSYGMTSGAMYEDGDLDADGDVDLTDLAEMVGLYGTTCH